MLNWIKRLLNNRRALIAAGVGMVLVLAGLLIYVVKLNRRISAEQEAQATAARIDIEETRLRPPTTDGMTVYLNAADARAMVVFAGTRYLATSGGLVALDEGGTVTRRYTTFDGLSDNDLTALAVFRDRLYIGTASNGLMAFDGNGFTGYRFVKPKATRVSVLVATESELLIGTLDGGLFEYDGQRFTRRFNSAAGADFTRVTALLPFASRLYVGTQDGGLYLWREGHIDHLTTSEGLPSPRITGLVALPSSHSQYGAVAVATDFGIVGLNDANEVQVITRQPNVTSIAVSGDRLFAGLFNGGLLDVSAERTKANASESRTGLSETPGLPPSVPTLVLAYEGSLWALTREGAFVREAKPGGPAFEAVAASLASERIITGDHITSVALDGANHLWVGYFDRGIDVIAPETSERLSHVEDDRIREVNFITYDSASGQTLIATSRGLVVIDGRMNRSVLTRQQNGLISDAIAHVSLMTAYPPTAIAPAANAAASLPVESAMVLATAGGLTEIAGGRARSLTAFHGLSSNHLYTSATAGSRLFVGSLAGLIELEGLRVVRTFKTSNSRISHDWVTALAAADGTLYVGTNGGGVDALLPTGEWVSFANDRDVGKFEVNQNAMYFDGERLYVGTGDKGLLVYNTRARSWKRINAGLSSPSVTAITSDDRYVYVGTMNGLVRIEKRVVE
jgi:ligand-binding sensor domain-containing protein